MSRGGRFESWNKGYQGQWLAHRYGRAMQVYNETVGTNFNSINGQRFKGTPAWVPPSFFDQTPVRDKYPQSDWPFSLISTKSQIMSPGSAGADSLHRLHPECQVVMHRQDAAEIDVRHGEVVRLITPGGQAQAMVWVRDGVGRGTIAIEHGYGHWGFGAMDMQVGQEKMEAVKLRGGGMLMNTLGLRDETRPGLASLGDFVCGSNARNAVPAKVEKIA